MTILRFAVLGALAPLLAIAQEGQGSAETLGGPTRHELDVERTDGGFHVPAGDTGPVDGGAPQENLEPPVLAVPSPAPYPEELAGQPVDGSVELELLISETGEVAEVELSRGAHPALDAAALKAARGLRFRPAALGGAPVSVRIRFTYEFVAPKPAPAQGTLRGVVRAKGNRKPIAGAVLHGPEGPLGESDSEGRFELTLPEGTHWLRVTAPGHKPMASAETLKAGEAVEVVFRLEALVTDPYETVIRGERDRAEVSRVTLVEQELREVPGTMGDPFRVVMLLPGVSTVASGLSYPVVRGSQPAATGYFIDGVRVPALFHLAVGPAVVHPDFIDRMDFFPGTPPAQYGRFLGGIVEGHPSRPRDDRLHASAYADLINAGGFVEYPFQESGTHLTLSGRVSYTPWLLARLASWTQPADEKGYRVRPVADFYDYQARVEQRIGEGRLRLLAFGSSDVVGGDDEDPEGFDSFMAMRFHRVDLRHRHPLPLGEAELGVTWGTEWVGLEGRRGDEPIGSYGLKTNNVASRASWSAPLGDKLRLSVGADMDHRRSVSSIRLEAAPGGQGSAFHQPLTLGTFFGLFCTLAWRPDDAWSLVAGLRADNYHLMPGIDRQAVEPRVTVRRRMSPSLTLKGGGGLVHQPPTVLINLPVMDIAGLRYGLQQAVQVDAGAEWAPWPGLEISLDVYYSHLTRTHELDLWQVIQERRRRGLLGQDVAGWGRSYGLELMVRHPLGGGWFGWVSYALQRSTRHVRYVRLDDQQNVLGWEEGELPFAFDQTHVFNAALSYQLPYNVTVGAVVHVNTGRPESGQISSRTARLVADESGFPVWQSVDRDQVERLPPFFRVDVRASKKWALQDYTVEAYLDVLNATLSREVLGYDYRTRGEPGSPLVGVKEPIEIPIVIPMLGVKGTF